MVFKCEEEPTATDETKISVLHNTMFDAGEMTKNYRTLILTFSHNNSMPADVYSAIRNSTFLHDNVTRAIKKSNAIPLQALRVQEVEAPRF
jgi:hypothetical protein